MILSMVKPVYSELNNHAFVKSVNKKYKLISRFQNGRKSYSNNEIRK